MLGLLRALRDSGLTVQPFKSGPDYIDPAFHFAPLDAALQSGCWAMPGQLMAGLVSLSADADLCLAEGSMGLFDGVAKKGQYGYGSSAETALGCGWPVVWFWILAVRPNLRLQPLLVLCSIRKI